MIKIYVIDLEGAEYALQATSINEGEVNGNQSISASILPSKVNKLFINDITELWSVVDHDDVEHKVIYCKRSGVGDSLKVEIKAIPLFFDTLDNDRIYTRYDEHMTAKKAFDRVFDETGFTYVLVDSFSAVDWEGFGDGDTKLETFKRCLERYKAEFRIRGNTVYLEKQIGRDTQFQYRYRLNASNIVQEIDANEMWTYAKGFGDYGDGEGGQDWQDAQLEREYISPLASILGTRHAPPIKNGNITTKSQMDNQLKTLVDESLKISVSADVYDLQKQGYPVAQSELGDRVFLIDERIGLDDEVRVVNQSVTRNWKGEVIDLNITFGSEGISKRHQANIQTAVKDITDLLNGKKQLPFSALDAAVQQATKDLKSAQTELIFDNGIIAQEKNDPNKIVLFNSGGIGISEDGGGTFTTAMTGSGIVADVITTGTLRAITVESVDVYGSYIEGSTFFSGDSDDYTEISNSTLQARGKFKRTWKGDTTNHDVSTRLKDGHLRFRDSNASQSIYCSSFGFSTFVDGEGEYRGEDGSSGTLEWWDSTYSEQGKDGITLSSYAGVPSLVSEHNKVVIHPFSDRSSKAFHFTKSSDGHDLYIHNSLFNNGNIEKRGGLRFTNDSKGTVQVVGSDAVTGGNTTIEAGIGRFNLVRRREGNSYVSIVGDNHLRVGDDSSGRRVVSTAIKDRTYDSSANVHITSEGTLGLSTSSEMYKLNIENQFEDEEEQLNHSKNILNLNIVKWNSKSECEIYAEEISQGKRLSEDNFKIKKYVGLTSEKVVNAGFPEHVQKDSQGNLQGIEYDRLWIHLLPIIKNQQTRIDILEELLNET